MFHVKHRRLPLLLAFVLALGCLSPALAAEGDAPVFSDVAPDAWYAPYVAVCVEEGLMEGVGDGRFDPQGPLTRAQVVTLALRVHQRRSGGDGVLPEAPEEWGRMTLTFEDGEVWPCYHTDVWDSSGNGWFYGGRTHGSLYFTREAGWAGKDYQRATLDFGGQERFTGAVHFSDGGPNSSLTFTPDTPVDGTDRFFQVSRDWSARCLPGPDKWWRDAAYYREQVGLDDDYALRPSDDPARRGELLMALSAVSQGMLEPINAIDSFPDADAPNTPEGAVLDFYRAGILTGIDEYGTFAATQGLTRAETAAMAARLLRPQLRISFRPKAPEYAPYTLTELSVPEGFVRDETWTPAQNCMILERPDEPGQPQAILRADGTCLVLEDGCRVGAWWEHVEGDVELVELHKTDPSVWASVGVIDLTTGEMALPFGHYDACSILPDHTFLTRSDGRSPTEPYCLRDKAGRELAQLYDTAQWGLMADGLAPCYDQGSGLYGYVDLSGRWVIPPQYGSAQRFRSGCAVVSREIDGQWYDGVIDVQGREVLPFQYADLEYRGDGLYLDSCFGLDSRWVELDGAEAVNGFTADFELYRSNGYVALARRYLGRDLRPVTGRDFDWTGPIGPDGSGFVGKDGKICRIQFEL